MLLFYRTLSMYELNSIELNKADIWILSLTKMVPGHSGLSIIFRIFLLAKQLCRVSKKAKIDTFAFVKYEKCENLSIRFR